MYGKRRLLTVAALLIGLWILGITGYVVIEGWGVLDAVYMTTISLTTVGYNEVHPLSSAGRIFTALLIAMGVGFFSMPLGYWQRQFLRDILRDFWEKGKGKRPFPN